MCFCIFCRWLRLSSLVILSWHTRHCYAELDWEVRQGVSICCLLILTWNMGGGGGVIKEMVLLPCWHITPHLRMAWPIDGSHLHKRCKHIQSKNIPGGGHANVSPCCLPVPKQPFESAVGDNITPTQQPVGTSVPADSRLICNKLLKRSNACALLDCCIAGCVNHLMCVVPPFLFSCGSL